MPIRLLLVDDHQIMREGLRSLIREESDFVIVGEAEDGRTAIEYAEKLGPHVILLDISMEGLNGIEATRQIKQNHPTIKIIGLSVHADRALVGEMLKAGASGYLHKDSAFDELGDAIRTVNEGKTYLSPEVTEGVVDSFIRHNAEEPEESAFVVLSDREREVLQLLAEGHTTKEIGYELGISVRTAETHRRNIMDKLKIHSVAELTKYAIRSGLTDLR